MSAETQGRALTSADRLPEKGDVLLHDGDRVEIEGWESVFGMIAAVCNYPDNPERTESGRYAVNLYYWPEPMVYVSRADAGPITTADAPDGGQG